MANAALELSFNGVVFQDWKRISLASSIAAAAGQVTVSMPLDSLRGVFPGYFVSVDLVAEETQAALEHLAGSKPRRKQFRKRMFSGWVEKVQKSVSDQGKQAVLTGRSLSGIFIDACPDLTPGEWHNVTLAEIANDIAAVVVPDRRPNIRVDYDLPMEDPVTLQPWSLPVLEKFALQQGESAWSAIERACRHCGVIAYSSPLGDLLFSQPATRLRDSAYEVSILEGSNLLSATLDEDHTERFSQYIVRGQRPGNDTVNGPDASQVQGISRGSRFFFGERGDVLPIELKKIIVAEGAVDPKLAATRAAWENTVRLAQSGKLTAHLAGLLVDPGYAGSEFWQVNRLYWVRINSLAIDRILLIGEVQYDVDRDQGTQVTLQFVDPNAYIALPEAPDEPIATPAARSEDDEESLL